MTKNFTNSFIFRHRHLIGFFIVAFLLYYFVSFGFARIPAGLSVAEMNSALLSASFDFPASIVNLPYHAFQWLSIQMFGLSTFSIRWPSIVIALLSGILIILTVRNLYKSNVAIITGMITASSVFFLEIARSGSPLIMGVFLLLVAIFSFSQYLVGKGAKSFWLLLTVLSLVVATYAPLGIYFLLCSIITAIFHPKIRAAILRFKIYQIILICIIAIFLLAPLIVAIAFDSSIFLTLLGVDNIQLSLESITANIAAIILPWQGSLSTGLVVPIISLAGLAIALIGAATLIRDRFSARAYITLGFAIIAIIFAILNIEFVNMLCIPMALLLAAGINTVIDSWYNLFPTNPVARFAGLIPLTILIVGMIVTSHLRFVNSNLYNDNVVYARNYTFEAVRQTVNENSAHAINLIVSEDELSFYSLLERDYPDLSVTTEEQASADTWILIPSTFSLKESPPSHVVNGWTRYDNVLVKVYNQ